MSTTGPDAGMSRNVVECIDTAARFLAAQPGAVQRALSAHRRGTGGRRTACGPMSGRRPCAIASSALRARELRDRTSPDLAEPRPAPYLSVGDSTPA